MAKYLLAYHGGSMPETDAERAQIMQAWGAWYGSIGAGVVDPGNPIGQARLIANNGSITHGGGANPVSGYSIISADDLDTAVAIAQRCPILQGGGNIEVCETFNVM